ncbi:MAG: MoaD/ThiS family protein [Nitrospinae bacterium]|nr:MoaD/ThiS family protein [Nitrospinota bacterium]
MSYNKFMITVRLFAIYRERAKREKIELDIKQDTQVGDLLEVVKNSVSSIRDLISEGKGMIAVNQEIANLDTLVRDGDEVALIPPVSGGTELVFT